MVVGGKRFRWLSLGHITNSCRVLLLTIAQVRSQSLRLHMIGLEGILVIDSNVAVIVVVVKGILHCFLFLPDQRLGPHIKPFTLQLLLG